uniref:Uncharacterized protein n=1 Tax=Anopheles atroparvus TaxID=41427 RepID=A0AAG5CQC4_ANOAO
MILVVEALQLAVQNNLVAVLDEANVLVVQLQLVVDAIHLENLAVRADHLQHTVRQICQLRVDVVGVAKEPIQRPRFELRA